MAAANTFNSLKPNYKESYSDGKKKKKDRFKRTKTLIQPPGKATAELEASKDPIGYIQKNKNMKIPPKGFAF